MNDEKAVEKVRFGKHNYTGKRNTSGSMNWRKLEKIEGEELGGQAQTWKGKRRRRKEKQSSNRKRKRGTGARFVWFHLIFLTIGYIWSCMSLICEIENVRKISRLVDSCNQILGQLYFGSWSQALNTYNQGKENNWKVQNLKKTVTLTDFHVLFTQTSFSIQNGLGSQVVS